MNLSGQEFLDVISKVHITKAKIIKWDCITLKSVCRAREAINRTKRHSTEWEKVYAHFSSGKSSELIFLNSSKNK